MATLTIYSDTADGNIVGQSSTYADARSTATSASGGNAIVGQKNDGGKVPLYDCWESFVSFDSTGGLEEDDTVSAAALSLYGSADSSTTDFTMQARTHDWGATLTTGDWVAGASLSGKTLQATFATSGGWSTSAYNDFASEAGFAAAVTKNGVTYLLINSSRHLAGTTPSGNEFVIAYTADTAGTDKDPKLVVTYTAAAPTPAAAQTIPAGSPTAQKARTLWSTNGWH